MNVDTTEESPTCITTCYGIGGLDEGLERVVGKLRKLCIVEIEAVAIANLVAKMEAGDMDPCAIWTDLKTFPAHLFRGRVDWLLGGYPCTPFSLAGKRRGADDPRHLWPHLERIIETVRPVRCLFENVDDHLTLGFPEVYCSLRNMGYSVEVGVYSAEEVGAPHERQRMFILATNMEHADSQRRLGEEGECEVGIDRAGELGNTPSIIKRKQADQTNPISDGRETRDESFDSSQLGNADESGLQRWNGGICEECTSQWITRSYGPYDRVSRWPSRPGQPQQAWEHPRVISREVESAMGLSTDGYHFREDFLRALGNMVVPDCAEKAIRELMNLTMKEKLPNWPLWFALVMLILCLACAPVKSIERHPRYQRGPCEICKRYH